MTPDEIRAQIAGIDTSDPEEAHSREDEIRHIVLVAIAEGHSDPSGMATAALSTGELEFERWYS